jgi:hypothetical protein
MSVLHTYHGPRLEPLPLESVARPQTQYPIVCLHSPTERATFISVLVS